MSSREEINTPWQEAKQILTEIRTPRIDQPEILKGGDHKVQYWMEETTKYGIIANIHVSDTNGRNYRQEWVTEILENEEIETGYETLSVTEKNGDIEFTTYVEDNEDIENLAYITELAKTM